MAYSELVKNFEKVRAYMREFYVYGFKSRTEYDARSARSYDDERRRLESWLGDHMRFTRTAEGKNVFFSVDSRVTQKNPFYKAWKAKSFTDGDITLHFAIFDILHTPEVHKTLAELLTEIDALLPQGAAFDESTLRKKLKEYAGEGIICTRKEGRRVYYSRGPDTELSGLDDVLDFFSEAAPCGVIGSFLQDKRLPHRNIFTFKHHYITQAMDSEVLAALFEAIRAGCCITADNLSRHTGEVKTLQLVPLKIYISAQNGRQNLIAYYEKAHQFVSYRLDRMSNIRPGEPCEKYAALRERLGRVEKYMWGVNCRRSASRLEHVEFVVRVDAGEEYIVNRLQREKRCGSVEKLDDTHYRFSADVFDTKEMLPWIRTFICRITQMDFSDRTEENRFREDIRRMYRMYGIDGNGGDGDAVQ